MGENFKRFKIKALKTRIAKSVMAALAAGLLVLPLSKLLKSLRDKYLRA